MLYKFSDMIFKCMGVVKNFTNFLALNLEYNEYICDWDCMQVCMLLHSIQVFHDIATVLLVGTKETRL